MIVPSTTIFDILAEDYDTSFTDSTIGRLQRKRVWTFLHPLLQAPGRSLKILEINCGTGEDALRLAALGHHVIATDASTEMIVKAKAKQAAAEINGEAVQFMVCPFDELSNSFANERFDLILSDFGGLNCIDRIALLKLADDLSLITADDGNIFFVLMAPFCLWEIGYYSIRGKFRTAFRRIKRSPVFTVNDRSMPVYYYRPATIKNIFSRAFGNFQKQPVGLFIPPSYLEERFGNDTAKLERLNRREERFGFPLFSSFADHYCAILKKTATTS